METPMPRHADTEATQGLCLPHAVLVRLDALAHNRHRSRSELIEEAAAKYLDSMEWLENAVKKGRDDYEAGRVYSTDAVKDNIRRLGINVA
jgi:predicted transcriptional regulator